MVSLEEARKAVLDAQKDADDFFAKDSREARNLRGQFSFVHMTCLLAEVGALK
jgi:hypothetical protein